MEEQLDYVPPSIKRILLIDNTAQVSPRDVLQTLVENRFDPRIFEIVLESTRRILIKIKTDFESEVDRKIAYVLSARFQGIAEIEFRSLVNRPYNKPSSQPIAAISQAIRTERHRKGSKPNT